MRGCGRAADGHRRTVALCRSVRVRWNDRGNGAHACRNPSPRRALLRPFGAKSRAARRSRPQPVVPESRVGIRTRVDATVTSGSPAPVPRSREKVNARIPAFNSPHALTAGSAPRSEAPTRRTTKRRGPCVSVGGCRRYRTPGAADSTVRAPGSAVTTTSPTNAPLAAVVSLFPACCSLERRSAL